MVDLTNIDSKLLLGILTPILLAAGYFYCSRKESIKNRIFGVRVKIARVLFEKMLEFLL